MRLIAAYLSALLAFGAIDIAWLSLVGASLYRATLGDILLTNLRVGPAIAFYLVFPIGIVAFATLPALKAGSLVPALGYGLLFGTLAYATYDLTNHATLRNWALHLTLIDIVYGAVASAIAAVAATAVVQHLPAWLGGTGG